MAKWHDYFSLVVIFSENALFAREVNEEKSIPEQILNTLSHKYSNEK